MAPGMKHAVAMLGIAMLGVSMLLAGPLAAQAGEWRSWCSPNGSGVSLGWHFYCDREETPEPEVRAPAPQTGQQNATERVLEMRRVLEEARAAAVLDPTPDKVAAYLRCNRRHCSAPRRSPTSSGARSGRRPISTTP